ncbi:MAG: hypothetical protein WEG40_12280 [Candidatus Rokuibacteriota bacterium]
MSIAGGLFRALEPFRWLMNDRCFARVPMVLEPPKNPEPHADREALALLRRFRA